MSLELVVNTLSAQSQRVMDTIEELGDAIPHGTPLGDAMLRLMDVVIELDTTVGDTQRAVAYLARNPIRSRRGRRSMEEEAELLRLRAEKAEWSEERAQLQQKLATVEHRLKNVQELNSMLMERAATPSSGFCSSASHSPRSDDEEKHKDLREERSAARTEPRVVTSILSPLVEQEDSLDYTPEFEAVTFKDSIRIHTRRPLRALSKADRTLEDKTVEEEDDVTFLSDSPALPNEGPLCSTFNDANERSVYHTPTTSKKNRRRSSSLGDVMKKIFTPHRTTKVKNPVLQID